VAFDTWYPQNPWASIATKTRAWYVPELAKLYFGATVYGQFVDIKFQFNGIGAEKMTISETLMPHPNSNAVGVRELYPDASHMDSRSRDINFARYWGSLAFHKYDSRVTFWQEDGVRGLRNIVNSGLAYHMMWVRETLARNAFFSNPYRVFGQGTGTNFAAITAADKITTDLIDSMYLGAKQRGAPLMMESSTRTPPGLICITSPGVIYDLTHEAQDQHAANAFINQQQYANPLNNINQEVGTYHKVRFIETNQAILYNCGVILTQQAVTTPIDSGDGAPDPDTVRVDGVYATGQSAAAHSIVVASTTGFEINDILTIHVSRTDANGVTNGVDYTDGKLHNLRLVAKTSTTLSFDKPLMEDFKVNLGGGVYAYVTKGRDIHTALFINSGDTVVNGILQPPMLYTPDPLDPTGQMYRFVWDSYEKFQLFNPQGAEMLFLAAPTRFVGSLSRK